MTSSILIANRGEIARRVLHSCRRLGIATVAVYSDADVDSPHVREADIAVRLPGRAATDTYLRIDLLVEAALHAGADSVHPGYGFLAESAAFARAVLDAGLTWIGPPPEAIAAMGSKIEAKRLMAAAGVPVLPELAVSDVTESDLPVLVKAAAGGGGRGMRLVRSLHDLPGQVAAASAEAAASFGDPTVFCESYVAAGRHVEVQIMADTHGTMWTIGERECSVQRRHQKVIEETPSPLVDRVPGMRERLFEAARMAAKAIDYVGAGTVEFMADETGCFWFLETNTRLQVEHTVTECTTGLDLVSMQIDVASGGRLPAEPPASRGHAIQARLYAEDPGAGFRPQTGRLHTLEVPDATARFTVPEGAPSGIRVDAGMDPDTIVSSHYDSMLAKVIAWSATRDDARRRLAAALARTRIHGVNTNRDLLIRTLRHPEFVAGDADTQLLEGPESSGLALPIVDAGNEQLAALAAALSEAAAARSAATVLGAVPGGWSNVPSRMQRRDFDGPAGRHEVRYRVHRGQLTVDGLAGIALMEATPDRVVLEDATLVARRFDISHYPGLVCVDSSVGSVSFVPVEGFPSAAEPAPPEGSLVAPTSGTIMRVAVAAGDEVVPGQPLVWLEAMKMQIEVVAPHGGNVAGVPVTVGQHVQTGTVLAIVEETP